MKLPQKIILATGLPAGEGELTPKHFFIEMAQKVKRH